MSISKKFHGEHDSLPSGRFKARFYHCFRLRKLYDIHLYVFRCWTDVMRTTRGALVFSIVLSMSVSWSRICVRGRQNIVIVLFVFFAVTSKYFLRVERNAREPVRDSTLRISAFNGDRCQHSSYIMRCGEVHHVAWNTRCFLFYNEFLVFLMFGPNWS